MFHYLPIPLIVRYELHRGGNLDLSGACRRPGQQGLVAKPKSDRWHKKADGDVWRRRYFLTTALMYTHFIPKTLDSMVVMGSASRFCFWSDLVDDFLNIKPYQKLIVAAISARRSSSVSGFPAADRQRNIDIC
jgi:hypothetical protein